MPATEGPTRRVAVYTLEPEEHGAFAEALERATGCGASLRPLRLKEVRHFRFPPTAGDPPKP